jgi:hypothetical protein
MNAAQKKMGIMLTWELIKIYYQNEIFAFSDDFFKGENSTKVALMFFKIYFFGKRETLNTMVGIFTKWLKLIRNIFHATNSEGLLKNIQDELKRWNKENPKDQKHFINWIPK